jgi:DNA invertase Pin-like site-specific DNA recombinase
LDESGKPGYVGREGKSDEESGTLWHFMTATFVLGVFGALAEFERNLIRERTQAGLQAARARGRKGGRRKKLDGKKVDLLYQLYDEKKHSIQELCDIMGISKSTLYDYIGRRKGIHAGKN